MQFFPPDFNPSDSLRPKGGVRARLEPETPAIDPLEVFESNFETYDKDSDGFLDLSELEIVESDKSQDDEIRRVAGLLKRDIASVEEYSDDELFDENDGITVNDLRKMRASNSSVPQPGFGNWLHKNLAGTGDRYAIGIVPIADPISWGEKNIPTRVLHIYRGSSAEYAGLQANDLITKIDGQDITQMSQVDVRVLLNGAKGSSVNLEVKRGWRTKSFTVPRKRQISSDELRTDYGTHLFGPSQAKDANEGDACRPNREYANIIKTAAKNHYNPFALGDISELIHKYDCVITDEEVAHSKAQSELFGATKDSYTKVKDSKEDEDEQEVAVEGSDDEDVIEKDLGDGIAYIRLLDFREKTDVAKMEEAIRKHSDAEAFVIDLRNNPGGLMHVAIDISSMLIESGDILRTHNRIESDPARPKYVTKVYSVDGNWETTEITNAQGRTSSERERRQPYLLDGRPVVLLVNRSSSSAAEIVAGALKDNGVATLLGSRTFGKGKGQTTEKVSNQHSLKMTTFRFTSPNGTWPGNASSKRHGISPDINLYMGSWIQKGSAQDTQLARGVEFLKKQLGTGM